jgi:hypothetical protein
MKVKFKVKIFLGVCAYLQSLNIHSHFLASGPRKRRLDLEEIVRTSCFPKVVMVKSQAKCSRLIRSFSRFIARPVTIVSAQSRGARMLGA